MNKSYIAVAVAGLAILLYFFSVQKSPNQIEKIVVGTSADYPPFEYLEKDEIVGFEIDLIREVAQRISRQIVIKDLPFDMLLQELQLGKIHVIASALTETPERAEKVIFTPAYMEGDTLLLLSLKDNPVNSINEIISKDKKIIVNEGYTSDIYVSKIDGLDITRLKSPAEAFLALNTKKADAFIIAANMAKPFFEKYSKEAYNIKEIEGSADSYALAISKEHPELLAPIAAALENMKRDGTIEDLKDKWQIT